MNELSCLPSKWGGGSNWSAFKLKGEMGITRGPACPRAPQIPAQRVHQHRAGLCHFTDKEQPVCARQPRSSLWCPPASSLGDLSPGHARLEWKDPSATPKEETLAPMAGLYPRPPSPHPKPHHSTVAPSPTASPSLPVTPAAHPSLTSPAAPGLRRQTLPSSALSMWLLWAARVFPFLRLSFLYQLVSPNRSANTVSPKSYSQWLGGRGAGVH